MHSRHRRRRDNVSVGRFFLEACHSGKLGKTKKDTEARVAGRRKEIKESAVEQLCMDNISTYGSQWHESNDSSISDSSESLSTSLLLLSSSRIFTESFFSLTSIFCSPYTIAIASCAWRTFTSSLVDVFSFLLRCFRFLKVIHIFNLVFVYLLLNRITPNTKTAW